MENYQGSTISRVPLISRSPGTNYCGIIVSPQRPDELQALWAQRVSDQQAKAWSTRLTEPKADGAPRWNAAWRRPNGQQHSEAIVPLLSTQHSGTLTSQTSPFLTQTVRWWSKCCNGGVCVNLLLLHVSALSHSLPRYAQRNIRTTNVQTHAAHTPVPVILL